jgi:hypothetical protein
MGQVEPAGLNYRRNLLRGVGVANSDIAVPVIGSPVNGCLVSSGRCLPWWRYTPPTQAGPGGSTAGIRRCRRVPQVGQE